MHQGKIIWCRFRTQTTLRDRLCERLQRQWHTFDRNIRESDIFYCRFLCLFMHILWCCDVKWINLTYTTAVFDSSLLFYQRFLCVFWIDSQHFALMFLIRISVIFFDKNSLLSTTRIEFCVCFFPLFHQIIRETCVLMTFNLHFASTKYTWTK